MSDELDFKSLLKSTGYAEKTECITKAFTSAGVKTYQQLQNAPGLIGTLNVCGVSIYLIVEAINEVIQAEEKARQEAEEKAQAKAGSSETGKGGSQATSTSGTGKGASQATSTAADKGGSE